MFRQTTALVFALFALLSPSDNAYAQLSSNDQQAMTTYLNALSSGWDQTSVNAANNIIDNSVYNTSDWRAYFATYFSAHTFSPDLYNYLGYPTFYWFDDAIHDKLQAALNPLATTKIAGLLQDHPTDLGTFLNTTPAARNDLTSWLHLMWNLGPHAAPLIDRRANFEWCKQLIGQYPNWFSTSLVIDPNAEPYMNYVRMQVHINLRDTLDLSDQVKNEIATSLGLSGARLQLWNTHAVLIHDNQFLKPPDYAFLQTFWDRLPPALTLPGNLSVNDALGNTGSQSLPVYSISGINVFAIHVGDSKENEFPDDSTPFFADLFALVAIHETNHVIDSGYVMNTARLRAFRAALLQDAGTDHLNYLRSMLPDGFFVQAPQEFFASMSNEYVANTQLTFELGKNRLQVGRHPPIEQFLFFLDVYSQETNVSRGYLADVNADLTTYNIPLQRDNQSRIVSLTLPTGSYAVTYGPDGHVVAIELQRSPRHRGVRH